VEGCEDAMRTITVDSVVEALSKYSILVLLFQIVIYESWRLGQTIMVRIYERIAHHFLFISIDNEWSGVMKNAQRHWQISVICMAIHKTTPTDPRT
jgi:hypothetical protein